MRAVWVALAGLVIVAVVLGLGALGWLAAGVVGLPLHRAAIPPLGLVITIVCVCAALRHEGERRRG